MKKAEWKSTRVRKRKKHGGWLLWGAVFVVFIIAAGRFWYQQSVLYGYNNQIEDIEIQIAEEHKRARQISEIHELYESDEYKERIAREQLKLVNPNQRIFIDIAGK